MCHMPGVIDAPSMALRAPPMPPAAPDPGVLRISLPENREYTLHNWLIQRSRASTISSPAPFCGANTRAEPPVPQNGTDTS